MPGDSKLKASKTLLKTFLKNFPLILYFMIPRDFPRFDKEIIPKAPRSLMVALRTVAPRDPSLSRILK